MKNLLLLFGGQSSEHVVSRNSAGSLLPSVSRDEFNIMTVGITRSGAWYLTKATPERIASGEWEHDPENRPAFLSPNRAMRGLQVVTDKGLVSMPVDVVFPLMHGELCEDGAIQGLLEMCGLPYVGPDVCASACCMDKSVTKLVIAPTGIRQAKYVLVTKADLDADAAAAAERVERELGTGYPIFVKPASAGSSVGVTKAHDRTELLLAFEKAVKVCKKIMAEEAITGHEVEVGVLGNADPQASCVGEILAANEFYDYEAKYENEASRTVIPAEIPEEASEKLRSAAVTVFRALSCEGMARVDFFLTPDGEVVFNEINTLPGFTRISMYPKLWEARGLSYPRLISRLCELAVERGNRMP